jgi:hypothetical protein
MNKDNYDGYVLVAIASPTDTVICISYKYLLLCFASEFNSFIQFFAKN